MIREYLASCAIGRNRRRCPSEATFRRAVTTVDPDELDLLLGSWFHTSTLLVNGRRVIAIDGKTVRGVRTQDAATPHLVAAFDHAGGTVLGQIAVAAKTIALETHSDTPASRTAMADESTEPYLSSRSGEDSRWIAITGGFLHHDLLVEGRTQTIHVRDLNEYVDTFTA